MLKSICLKFIKCKFLKVYFSNLNRINFNNEGKIRYTISIKMTILIVLISAFLIGNLAYFNYKDQIDYYNSVIKNRAADSEDVLESFIIGVLSDKTNTLSEETDKEKINYL